MDRNLSIGPTIIALLILLVSGLIANIYKVQPDKLSGAEVMTTGDGPGVRLREGK